MQKSTPFFRGQHFKTSEDTIKEPDYLQAVSSADILFVKKEISSKTQSIQKANWLTISLAGCIYLCPIVENILSKILLTNQLMRRFLLKLLRNCTHFIFSEQYSETHFDYRALRNIN